MYLSKDELNDILNRCNHEIIENEQYISLSDLRLKLQQRPNLTITADEALNIMADLEFKKSLGVDCTAYLIGILNHERMEKVEWYLKNKPDNWFIFAVKLYREINNCGLADAKYAVEKRMKDLGITR